MPKLFSYGTLQQENVQIATFGRSLLGTNDALVGYRQSMVAIDDPEVVRTSGKTHHPIVAFTGASQDRVPGMTFDVSDAELAQADEYEVDAYVRVLAPLASGMTAWVYVDARRQAGRGLSPLDRPAGFGVSGGVCYGRARPSRAASTGVGAPASRQGLRDG